ncbi:cyclodeaminase [Halobacillus sp. Marseille-Q1614]|uniref:cyclodeaminase n=1 Tax=Halobacillus sp. Marseille-Q1614 TaxID=2709134 RepID=UPI00156D7E16|nr:cyclodeaminase [Halobacillus sp. Marseille-Q1614]
MIIQLYNRDEIERVIRLDTRLIQEVETAFTALSTKRVTMPPIMRIDMPEHNGEVDIKSAYIEGVDSFAVKLSSGFFNNPKIGLPSANGMMILLNSKTGEPQAIFADNGLLTDLRTAAAGAVAAGHLSRQNSRVAGIIGTGSQARYQLQALLAVRPIEKAFVYGRSKEKTERFKTDMEGELGIPVHVALEPEDVVRNSDIVVTTTPSTEPIVNGDWLSPGVHVTAMGSDAEHKKELDERAIEASDLFVCDTIEQSKRLGELRNLQNDKLVHSAVELGDITSGHKPGRSSEDQITICDLTGTGVQDTVIARYAFQLLEYKEEDIHERR